MRIKYPLMCACNHTTMMCIHLLTTRPSSYILPVLVYKHNNKTQLSVFYTCDTLSGPSLREVCMLFALLFFTSCVIKMFFSLLKCGEKTGTQEYW